LFYILQLFVTISAIQTVQEDVFADCMALQRRRSGLRQVTRTDKMTIRK